MRGARPNHRLPAMVPARAKPAFAMNSSMILIVEDESLMRNMLEALFTPDGYALSFACDGGEALRRAAEIVPDLILLDVDLPGMDGFEVCRRAAARPPGAAGSRGLR